MTDQYWWSGKAWGEKTVDLLHHLSSVKTPLIGNVEIMMGSCGLAADSNPIRYQASDIALIPPATFFANSQSVLGDHLHNSSSGEATYRAEKIASAGAEPTLFERWLHNFTILHYWEEKPVDGINEFTGLGAFHTRHRLLARYTDWSAQEVTTILDELHKVMRKEGRYGRDATAGNWHDLVTTLPATDPTGHLSNLMLNHHLPVGDASGVYREVVTAILRKFGGHTFHTSGSVIPLGFLSQNPNTPTDLLVEAYEILMSATDFKLRLPSYEQTLLECLEAFRTHPNFPDRKEPEATTQSYALDEELALRFFSKASTMELAAICKELLTVPSREGIARRLATKVLEGNDIYRMSLLLPAVGAILEEADQDLRAEGADVPFEWLREMVAA